MKFDIASLGIGAAAGAAIVTVAIAIFAMQPEKVVLDSELAKSAVAANNGTHFYLSGLVTEMSGDMMILDQTFGRPDFNDNPRVSVRLDWAAFVACVGTGTPGEGCKDSVSSRIGKEPVYLCALTRMYDGEFYAGKIWADSGCGPFLFREE
jgi:hypothetical protein